MLKKINEGRVESDNGFSIHITGLESMRYQEDNNFIDIEWNYDPKTRKTCIYISGVSSWDKPPHKKLNESERKRIMNNIKDAVKLLKGNFEVV